ncbi:UNVERIFIED_CONTAM: hypothetical protein Slati_0935100 [Sesamum latifolium]|uniref:Uncharacterized protein n=1 Tax=Sesamum latifolium TaxID=2727402 RepID=A0AAW2XP69_9LAMI
MPPTSASGGSTPTSLAPMLPPPRVVDPIADPPRRKYLLRHLHGGIISRPIGSHSSNSLSSNSRTSGGVGPCSSSHPV